MLTHTGVWLKEEDERLAILFPMTSSNNPDYASGFKPTVVVHRLISAKHPFLYELRVDRIVFSGRGMHTEDQNMAENVDNKTSRASLLLSRSEAALYLGISKQTLAIWNCTGRYHVPFVKIGRLVKYRKSDLDNFIANNRRGAS